MSGGKTQQGGFVLILVVMAIVLIAAIAYLMNSQNAMYVDGLGKEIESTETQYVAMSGVSHMLWQTNKSGCTGYANLTNVPLGDNSYSATITPTSGSPVSISVLGTHAGGASYRIQRDRVPVYQAPTNTQLIMGAGALDKDTILDDFYSSRNYGGANYLKINSAPAWIQRPLLQFDLSSIPAGVKILSATLALRHWSTGAPGVFDIM